MPVPAGTGLDRRSPHPCGRNGARRLQPTASGQRCRGVAEAARRTRTPTCWSVFLEGADPLTSWRPARPNYPGSAGSRSRDARTPHASDSTLRWHPSAQVLATLDRGPGRRAAISYPARRTAQLHVAALLEDRLASRGRRTRLAQPLPRHNGSQQTNAGAVAGLRPPADARATRAVAAVSLPSCYRLDANVAVQERGWTHRSDRRCPRRNRERLREPARFGANPPPFIVSCARTGPAAPPCPTPRPAALPAPLATLAPSSERVSDPRLGAQGDRNFDAHARAEVARRRHEADLRLPARLPARHRGPRLAERVLTHVWSSSAAGHRQRVTRRDHGAAGISFIIGEHAKSGQLSQVSTSRSLQREGESVGHGRLPWGLRRAADSGSRPIRLT